MQLQYPQLFFFARNSNISVQAFCAPEDIHDNFSLPLSAEAFQQFTMLQSFIMHFPLIEQNDVWKFSWGTYSAAPMYLQLVGHRQTHPVFQILWKSCCQPKHKVFFWLLLNDRLSTRNILKRKNMHLDSYECVLCQSATEECRNHLFVNCQFARSCWHSIGINLQSNIGILEAIRQIRSQSHQDFYILVVIVMCWAIWSIRNDWIFKGIPPDIQRVKHIFLKEIKILALRIKVKLSGTF